MSFKRKSYSAVLAVLLLGILLTGAYALSMLIDGQAAYPVHMIGHAKLSAEVVDALHIRPPANTKPAEGVLPAILPMPPAPEYPDGNWSKNDLARSALVGPETRVLDAARKLNEAQEWDRSLSMYDALVAKHPDSYDLALERAHVLAWAGRDQSAAVALMHAASMRRNATVAFEAAQNYWWGGNVPAADSAVSVVLDWAPAFPGALPLRAQIRASASPSVALAREWARDGGELEQLLYARALVASKDYTTSLDPYRRAIALGAPDSITLELAAAASAADSNAVAVSALHDYLNAHPDAADIRVTLARQYVWAENYKDALHEFDRLIADGHREYAFERAQTVVWSGALDQGAADLERVVAQDSTQAEAWRLLGDVQHWRAKPKEALAAYEMAQRLQPDDREIPVQIAAVQQEMLLAGRGALPVSSARVNVTGMQDNQGFTYVETRADQFMGTHWGGFELSAINSLPASSSAAYSANSDGYGVGGGVTYNLRRNIHVIANGDVQHFGDVGTFLGLDAGVTFDVVAGTSVHVGYVREPAVRRASTLLALQARTVSERLELLASGKLGTWLWSAEGSTEKFASDLGDTRREEGALTATYDFSKHFAFDSHLSAIGANKASPSLPGFGALYWSPVHYIEPSAGLSWKTQRGKNLTVGAGMQGGYAFAKERPGPGARFTQGGVPTFALTANAAYQHGPWGLLLDIGYGGALQRGYRSMNSALGITYTIPK